MLTSSFLYLSVYIYLPHRPPSSHLFPPSSCGASNVRGLTGSPLTSSRAIQRGAEPPVMRPSKRQRHSESTLEAGRHNLLLLIEHTKQTIGACVSVEWIYRSIHLKFHFRRSNNTFMNLCSGDCLIFALPLKTYTRLGLFKFLHGSVMLSSAALFSSFFGCGVVDTLALLASISRENVMFDPTRPLALIISTQPEPEREANAFFGGLSTTSASVCSSSHDIPPDHLNRRPHQATSGRQHSPSPSE